MRALYRNIRGVVEVHHVFGFPADTVDVVSGDSNFELHFLLPFAFPAPHLVTGVEFLNSSDSLSPLYLDREIVVLLPFILHFLSSPLCLTERDGHALGNCIARCSFHPGLG